MTILRYILRFTFAVCLCLAFLERPAHAYVDPGTGSMLMQLVLGGIVGLAIALKLYWRRIKAALGWRKAGDPVQAPVPEVASSPADEALPK